MALCKKVKFKLTFLYKHFTDLIVAKYFNILDYQFFI